VQDLAQRYGVDDAEDCAKALLTLVGGSPYLVQLGLHHISMQDVTLYQLVENPIVTDSIFNTHLRNLLWDLQRYPELLLALKGVVSSSTPVEVEAIQAFKLQSKGLVRLDDQKLVPSCNLYRKYFAQALAAP
jgi:hypothetical protein